MKKKIMSFIIFLTFAVPGIALADTSTVTKTPKIEQGEVVNQGDDVESKATEYAKNYSEKLKNDTQKDASNIANQVEGGASSFSGNGTNLTNTGIQGLFQRLSNVITDTGTGSIGLLAKVFYYSSFVGIFISAIGLIISFFSKKGKPMKWILALVFCGVVYLSLISLFGISISNNPISEIFKYIAN